MGDGEFNEKLCRLFEHMKERKIDINGEEYMSVSKASYRIFKAVELGLLTEGSVDSLLK